MSFWESANRFVTRYERHISVLSMVGGFIADNFGLHRADLPFETYLLYVYLALSGIFIILVHLAEEGVWRGRYAAAAQPWLLIALQFISGSTFSAFIVFYSRSASFSATWPFLVVLFAIFAGTEIFKHYQGRLAYQLALYFFGILSFSIYSVPLAVGAIGTDVFLLSGAAAAGAFAFFCALLFAIGRRRFQEHALRVFAGAAAVFVLMNIFYFTHLLPPLPLVLRDIGVYHTVVHVPGAYDVAGEPEPLLDTLFGTAAAHILPGDPVFVFSSVFTPVAIKTDIIHRWERWDAAKNRWVPNTVIEFPVVGGRDGGYGGYSEIPGIPAGLWRVSVETPDGQIIGRVEFTVEYVSAEPPLVERVL